MWTHLYTRFKVLMKVLFVVRYWLLVIVYLYFLTNNKEQTTNN